MRNAFMGGLVVAVVLLGAYVIFNKSLPQQSTYTYVEQTAATPLVAATPITASILPATPSPMASAVPATGIISGKLCYPSQFLPKGNIEAKEVLTNKVTTLAYPGSNAGGKSNYSMDLTAGTYILRYRAETSPGTYFDGYHTQTCLAGLETSCAQANARVHAKVELTSGATVQNIDLCDFYYDPQKPPTF